MSKSTTTTLFNGTTVIGPVTISPHSTTDQITLTNKVIFNSSSSTTIVSHTKETYKCSSCKKNYAYNLSVFAPTIHISGVANMAKDDRPAVIYEGPKFKRKICKHCYIRAMDKFYNVDIDSEKECVLYE